MAVMQRRSVVGSTSADQGRPSGGGRRRDSDAKEAMLRPSQSKPVQRFVAGQCSLPLTYRTRPWADLMESAVRPDSIVLLEPTRTLIASPRPVAATLNIRHALSILGRLDAVASPVVDELPDYDTDLAFTKALRDADLVIADLGGGDVSVSFRMGLARGLNKPILAFAHADLALPLEFTRLPVVLYDKEDLDATGIFPQLLHALRRAVETPALLMADAAEFVAGPGSVFLSYSHRDSLYVERLLVHLRPLERQGLISLWADTRLSAGERWRTEIESAVSRARVAVLLVSPDFLDSEFILTQELPQLLARAAQEGTVILPIIVRPCRFAREPQLTQFQAVNDPSSPLSELSEDSREIVYDRVAARLERIVKAP